MSRLAGSALCTVLLATGCGQELERQSLVQGLRVLAVSAEPPEVAPGAPVVVSALWHDDAEAAPTFRWSRCPAPANGDIQSCAGPESPLGEGEGMQDVSFAADREDGTTLVRLSVCSGPSGNACADDVEAVKRVVVGDADHPNANPVIESFDVTLAGGDDEATVELVAAPGSAETNGEGEPEELFVSWFATGGSFEEDRSFGPESLRFETTWSPPEDPADVTLWAVLRDGRGGVAWAEATY